MRNVLRTGYEISYQNAIPKVRKQSRGFLGQRPDRTYGALLKSGLDVCCTVRVKMVKCYQLLKLALY